MKPLVERLRAEGEALWRERMAPLWERLAPRERRLLIVAAVALSILLFVFGFWLPVRDRIHALEQALPAQRVALAEANRLADLLQHQSPAGQSAKGHGDVLTLVEQTAGATGMRQFITRIRPETDAHGKQTLRLRLRHAPWPKLARFLARLARHGAAVGQARLLATDRPGLVDGELVLKEG